MKNEDLLLVAAAGFGIYLLTKPLLLSDKE